MIEPWVYLVAILLSFLTGLLFGSGLTWAYLEYGREVYEVHRKGGGNG